MRDGLIRFLLGLLRLTSRVLDDRKLRVIHLEDGWNVTQVFDRYYPSTNPLDVGDLALVWHRPKTYNTGNGPVTLISKDRRGAYWVYGYGYEKFMDPSEPYREHSGDPRLTGFVVDGAQKLPPVALLVYEPPTSKGLE